MEIGGKYKFDNFDDIIEFCVWYYEESYKDYWKSGYEDDTKQILDFRELVKKKLTTYNMKHIKPFDSFINESLIFSYDELPVVGDIITKVVYTNDETSFEFENGRTICVCTSLSDMDIAISKAGLKQEYADLKNEFEVDFVIDGRKSEIMDFKLVIEKGKKPRIVIWVCIENPAKRISADYYLSDYVDFEPEELRNKI